MKRVIVAFLWFVLILPTFLQCDEATFFFPEEVYVVGLGADEGLCGGAIWKNKDSPLFTDLDRCNNLIDINHTGGQGVAMQDGVVLVAGQSLEGMGIIKGTVPTLWRNGVKELLVGWGSSYGIVTDISVSGDGIYITGFGGYYSSTSYHPVPVLWENGSPDTLRRFWPQFVGTCCAYEPAAVHSDGDNVAVAGTLWDNRRSDAFGFRGSMAVYWLNSDPVFVDTLAGYHNSTAYDVDIIGNDVYAVGIIHEKPYGKISEGLYMAALWKNGELQTLADGGVAYGIAHRGDDILLVGGVGGRPVYWLNGTLHELGTPEGYSGTAVSIFIRNEDIFIAGMCSSGNDFIGGYWRNGLFYGLEKTFQVRDIVATPY